MQIVQLLVASFLLAAVMFLMTMLFAPPISVALAPDDPASESTPLVLVGP